MVEDFQGLLDRIQSDGLQKAEQERGEILAKAEQEAAKLLAAARAEAETLLKDASARAELARESARTAIQQAARDILITLKVDLEKRLKAAVQACAGAAMTPEVMAKLVLELAQNGSAAPTLMVRSQETADQLLALLKSSLRQQPVILTRGELTGGLKIAFQGDEVFLDFSDEALAELFCEYAGPKLAAAIRS